MHINLRVRRTNYFFLQIVLAVAFNVAVYFLTGVLRLTIDTGLVTTVDLFASPVGLPLAGLAVLHDIAVFSLTFGRLQDTGRTGWWVLLLIPFAIVAPLLPNSLAVLAAALVLLAMIALLFLPGTIGPNRFGRDPRGWKSREHYDEQRAALRSGGV